MQITTMHALLHAAMAVVHQCNSRTAQYRSHSLNLLHSLTHDSLTPFDSNDS